VVTSWNEGALFHQSTKAQLLLVLPVLLHGRGEDEDPAAGSGAAQLCCCIWPHQTYTDPSEDAAPIPRAPSVNEVTHARAGIRVPSCEKHNQMNKR